MSAPLYPVPPTSAGLNPTLTRLLELCRLDRRWVRGKGVWLFDENGRWFLDAYAQYGAVALGHSPEAPAAALREALDQGVPAMVQPYRAIHAEGLARELIAKAPGNLVHCVFTTSGSEAVEAAVKLVRAKARRPVVITARGGYHGKTLGTLALHPESRHADGFGPFDAGSVQVPWGDEAALRAAVETHSEELAGILLEPILGEGGVHLPPKGYLAAARRLCDEHDASLIFDEVQTGLGRTGTWFACEAEGVAPDVLTVAKALSGGLTPLGACLASEATWSDHFGLGHSSTFANNNLSCAVGRAVLRELEARDLPAEAARKGERLLKGLEALAKRYPRWIAEARGRGLLTALELRVPDPATSGFLNLLSHHGVYAYAFAGALARCASLLVLPTLGPCPVLRIAPPLTISDAELEVILEGLAGVFEALEREGVALLMGALGPTPEEKRRVTPASAATPPAGTPLEPALAAEQQAKGASPAKEEASVAQAAYASLAGTRSRDPRPAALPKPRLNETVDYAFVAHLTRPEELLLTNPGLKLPPGGLQELSDLLAQLPPVLLCEAPTLRSPSGREVKGVVILLPLLPAELRRLGARAASMRVRSAVDLAVSLGARVVGLGGHTTPFSRHGRSTVGRGARITTGNALTAGAALDAVEARLGQRGTSFAALDGPVAVVGGGGSVGGLCARLAARAGARRLHLIGNPSSGLARLERLRDGLIEAHGCEVEIGTSLEGLRDAPVVFAATTSRGGLLDEAPLAPGAIVCDLARPSDASPELLARADLDVFEGGLVRLPDSGATFGPGNLVGLPAGVQLACLAETIVLSFDEEGEDHVGRDVPLELVDRVRALAVEHGFHSLVGEAPSEVRSDSIVDLIGGPAQPTAVAS